MNLRQYVELFESSSNKRDAFKALPTPCFAALLALGRTGNLNELISDVSVEHCADAEDYVSEIAEDAGLLQTVFSLVAAGKIKKDSAHSLFTKIAKQNYDSQKEIIHFLGIPEAITGTYNPLKRDFDVIEKNFAVDITIDLSNEEDDFVSVLRETQTDAGIPFSATIDPGSLTSYSGELALESIKLVSEFESEINSQENEEIIRANSNRYPAIFGGLALGFCLFAGIALTGCNPANDDVYVDGRKTKADPATIANCDYSKINFMDKLMGISVGERSADVFRMLGSPTGSWRNAYYYDIVAYDYTLHRIVTCESVALYFDTQNDRLMQIQRDAQDDPNFRR